MCHKLPGADFSILRAIFEFFCASGISGRSFLFFSLQSVVLNNSAVQVTNADQLKSERKVTYENEEKIDYENQGTKLYKSYECFQLNIFSDAKIVCRATSKEKHSYFLDLIFTTFNGKRVLRKKKVERFSCQNFVSFERVLLPKNGSKVKHVNKHSSGIDYHSIESQNFRK